MLTKSCFLCIDFGNESLLLPAALLFVCSLPFISSADSSFSLPEIAVRHLSCVLLLTGCFVRKVLKKETLLLECPLRFSLHYWFLLLCSISTASLFKVNLTVDSLMNTESVPNGLMQLDINKESVIWIHASLRWGSISVISCLSVKVWINSVLSQNSSLAATSSKWMSLHYRLLHSSKDIRFGVDCGFNWIPIRLCATHLVSPSLIQYSLNFKLSFQNSWAEEFVFVKKASSHTDRLKRAASSGKTTTKKRHLLRRRKRLRKCNWFRIQSSFRMTNRRTYSWEKA